jgi:hypothetical protein
VYHLTVMTRTSMPNQRTIRLWWREHQRRSSVLSGCDDENINAGPAYQSPLMYVPSHAVGVPSGGNEGSVTATVVFVPAVMFHPLPSALTLYISIVHNTL